MTIENILPKDSEISKTSGEIVLGKDARFDILCFDINFDRYFPARICLWPINNLTAVPTPQMDCVSSLDSGLDRQ